MGVGQSTHIPLDVRATNHPPYLKNKLKRAVFGDPVKSTIARMISYPDSIDILEMCCRRMKTLALGGPNAQGLMRSMAVVALTLMRSRAPARKGH